MWRQWDQQSESSISNIRDESYKNISTWDSPYVCYLFLFLTDCPSLLKQVALSVWVACHISAKRIYISTLTKTCISCVSELTKYVKIQPFISFACSHFLQVVHTCRCVNQGWCVKKPLGHIRSASSARTVTAPQSGLCPPWYPFVVLFSWNSCNVLPTITNYILER